MVIKIFILFFLLVVFYFMYLYFTFDIIESEYEHWPRWYTSRFSRKATMVIAIVTLPLFWLVLLPVACWYKFLKIWRMPNVNNNSNSNEQ